MGMASSLMTSPENANLATGAVQRVLDTAMRTVLGAETVSSFLTGSV